MIPFLAGVVVAVMLCTTPTMAQRFVDPRDNESYAVVTVAGMTWMGENLKFATEGSWCPQGDEKLCETMGRLYPWTKSVRCVRD